MAKQSLSSFKWWWHHDNEWFISYNIIHYMVMYCIIQYMTMGTWLIDWVWVWLWLRVILSHSNSWVVLSTINYSVSQYYLKFNYLVLHHHSVWVSCLSYPLPSVSQTYPTFTWWIVSLGIDTLIQSVVGMIRIQNTESWCWKSKPQCSTSTSSTSNEWCW